MNSQSHRHQSETLVRPVGRTVALLGASLLALGISTLAWVVVMSEEPIGHVARSLGVAGVTSGLVIVVYAALRSKGRSIEEAYRLGYDVGYENGYRSGAAESEVNPLVAERDELARRRHHAALGDVAADERL